MDLLMIGLLGYVIGSVPFALVIGQLFYATDVRCYGSGNLGATNAGRVLGKVVGVTVMTLDLLKVTLVVYLSTRLSDHPYAIACGGIAAALGHCYPLLAGFRGGKAVAGLYGFLFGLWVYVGVAPTVFFVPLFTFWVILYLFKTVSLSGMVSAVAAAMWIGAMEVFPAAKLTVAVFAVLIILRHHENIHRILRGTEAKVSWI